MGLGLFCGRRYTLGLFAWILVYYVTMATAMYLEFSPYLRGPARVLVGLVPTIPLVCCMLWSVHEYRTGDELQKRVTADGIMFAFCATAIIALSYGFLEVVVGLPSINALFIWAVMGTAWVVGSFFAKRRYC